jgi:cysteine-rich repeat protein
MIDAVCSFCAPGYQQVDGSCQAAVSSIVVQDSGVDNAVAMGRTAVCGNGIIEQLEQCDDHNTKNGDGCSSTCLVEAGYTCTRMPSQCLKTVNSTLKTTANATVKSTNSTNTNNSSQSSTIKTTSSKTSNTAPPPPVTAANSSSAGLTLQTLSGNSNQIFLTVNTGVAFDFPDQATMQSFLKAKFTGCAPPTFYFSQRPQPNKNLFDCLLIFPSGIPNSKFTAAFSYSYSGASGQLSVPVDPLAITSSMANSRSSSTKQGNKIK